MWIVVTAEPDRLASNREARIETFRLRPVGAVRAIASRAIARRGLKPRYWARIIVFVWVNREARIETALLGTNHRFRVGPHCSLRELLEPNRSLFHYGTIFAAISFIIRAIMIPNNLKYKPIADDEAPLCGNILYSILTNSEIMGTVRSRHSAGVRCAVISILENGEIVSGYVADQEAIRDLVPFSEVREAVASYKMNDSICSVVIRDGVVAATISGNL